jgi:hypothetical protein
VARDAKTLAVRTAADLLGGPRKLRDRLRVPSADVAAWMAGREEPPTEVFLRVVELILDELEAGHLPRRPGR